MTPADQQQSPTSNAEAIEASDGPLFERFVEYRHIVVAGLSGHGDEAMRLHPPQSGDRILDIGCGFGDTTRQLAALAGPEGLAVGVDAFDRFIAAARRETQGEDLNVRFEVADVQAANLGDRINLVFSQFGTMFFASPVAALQNVREAMEPTGKLVIVVWRSKRENEWLYRAQTITERFIARPQEYDAPTCGPGPVSMADAGTTSEILAQAGFQDISLRRCDLPITIGANIDEAVEFANVPRTRRRNPPPRRRARLAPTPSDRRRTQPGVRRMVRTERHHSPGLDMDRLGDAEVPSVKPTTLRGPRQAHRTSGRSGNSVD